MGAQSGRVKPSGVGWRKGLRLLVLVTALLGGCALYDRYADAPLADPDRQDVLAPYEAAQWPRYLDRLGLPRDRDFVIMAFLPTRYPLDLSDPEAARRSFLKAALSPGMDTKIGHTIVGWQCGRHRGMTSMSGANGPEAFRLLREGWGFVAALSTYTDGKLYPEGEHRIANLEALEAGRGIVTAVEVSRDGCAGLRRALTGFLTHPDAPVEKFGLMLDPGRFEGGGCISFGFYLANAAGAMGEVSPHIRREVPLHAPMLGRGGAELPTVVHYRPPAGCCGRPVTLDELLFKPWDAGPEVDRVRVEDGELVIAALVAARQGVAAPDDWRFARVLARSDPPVARAWTAGEALAARYPVRWIADPDGVQALVLARE
jgi:hypothetical protein